MKSITVDGKDYVKASVIARDLGYTADYVGQLCRGEKVDAQLVGRSWYVHEDSLREHKNGRYRSNKKTAVREVEKMVKAQSAQNDESLSVAIHTTETDAPQVGYANQSFYTRVKKVSVPTYEEDTSGLLPETAAVQKSGRVGVHLAGAHNIRVSSKNKAFDFNPTKRPKLTFKGNLTVREAEDESARAEDDVSEAVQDPVKVSVVSSEPAEAPKAKKSKIPEKTSKIKVVHRRASTKKKKKNAPREHNTQGILGMKRQKIVDRNPVGGTLRINTPRENRERKKIGFFTLTVASVCAIVLAVLVTTIEQHVYVINDETVVRYSLEFESIVAAAYEAFR